MIGAQVIAVVYTMGEGLTGRKMLWASEFHKPCTDGGRFVIWQKFCAISTIWY